MLSDLDLELVLNDWNYWQKLPSDTVPRMVLQSPLELAPDLVLVIQGVRRSGKSTLLAQIMQKNNLSPQDCTFINFEDPRLSGDLNHTLLDRIVSSAKKRRPKAKKLVYFLDEIQSVSEWQKWLRVRVDRPTADCFVITGSNAALLSGELASTLTGRHITLELFPFDFSEYRLSRAGGGVLGYLKEGGFPRALSYPDPERLLREYFTDIVERDVRRHVAVRSSSVLVSLAKAVFESMGSETSQRSLAGMLGVTTDTVGTYLKACEAAYLILPCPYFTFSERQRTARNRKYYPVDLGLRTVIAARTGFDEGKNLEGAVFLHLRRKYSQVFYWRGKCEVDFVVQDQTGITPFQVSRDGLKPRHEMALKEFHATFPQSKAPVIVTGANIGEFLSG